MNGQPTGMTPDTPLTQAHFAAAGPRGEIYRLLSEFTAYPSPSLMETIRDGSIHRTLSALLEELPYCVSYAPPEMPEGCHIPSEYLRLFELPGDTPPCPLYGGLFENDRKAVMEELLRYYRHFGLSTEHAAVRDTPDSLSTLLEFLYFLCRLESNSEGLQDAEACRRAQQDLLVRHLTVWTTAIMTRLARKNPLPLYRVGIGLLNDYCRGELGALGA